MTSECLVCTVFDRTVCLPVSAIQGIAALYCTTAVPCTAPWVLGLGMRDNRVFTVVCPAPKQERAAPPIAEAKMLLSRETAPDLNWALRIDQVLGMASVTVDDAHNHIDAEWKCPHDWFRPAKTSTGRDILWLDPKAVSNSLGREAV